MQGTRTAPDPLEQLATGEHTAVFGAPGSGKTTLAIELVADRVERLGYSSDEVLVVSATRSAATSLRDALAVRLGVTTRGPLARTANSIAFQLVRAYTGAPVTLLTGAEHDQIIGELLEGGIRDGFGPEWPDPLTPDVRSLRGFRSELRDLMMRAVEHGIDAGRAHAARAARRGGPSGSPRGRSSRSMPRSKSSCGRPSSIRASSGRSRRRSCGAAPAMPRRSERWAPWPGCGCSSSTTRRRPPRPRPRCSAHSAHAAPQVVALGDPDVASNGFRGGRPELLGSLTAVLDGAEVHRVELPSVHRGNDALRRVVQSATTHIGTALGGRHRTATHGGASAATEPTADPLAPVLGIEAPSHAAECQAVAGVLRERHLLDGVPWSKMAVVLRSGGDVPAFERGLALADVPTAGSAARTALRDAPAAAALLAAASLYSTVSRSRRTRGRVAHRAHRAARRRGPSAAAPCPAP